MVREVHKYPVKLNRVFSSCNLSTASSL